MNKDIKLVAIDLDGTLLGSDKKIPEKNKEVLEKLQQKGMKIVLATGRPFNGFWWIRQELGLEGWDDYSISNTGAFVRRNADGKALVDNSMTRDDYEKILSYMQEFDLQLGVFTKGTLYNNADEVNGGFLEDQNIIKMPRLKFEKFTDIKEKVGRINFMGEAAELDRFYETNKKEIEKSYMTMRNETYSLEILKKSAGKAKSLEKLCQHLGVSLADVAYIGDGVNDREAIALAGIGVAMANGTDEAKEVSDYLTKSNDEAGVGHFLKQFL